MGFYLTKNSFYVGPAYYADSHGSDEPHIAYDGNVFEIRGTLHADDINAANITVQTLNIADNAVTVPVSAYDASQITIPWDTQVTVQQAAIDADGGDVFITFSGFMPYNYPMELSVYRDTTPIYISPVVAQPGSPGFIPTSISLKDTPGVGSHTYYVKGYNSMANSKIQNRSLLLLGVKR